MRQFIPVTEQTRALFKLKDFPFKLIQYFHWFVGLNVLSSFWLDHECAQNTQLDNSPKGSDFIHVLRGPRHGASLSSANRQQQ